MGVTISSALLGRIFAHVAADPTREACGLLLGEEGHIGDAVPAANVAADPARRFEVDPQTLFDAIRAERAGGAKIVGHYHSHPSGDPRPSACDAAVAEPGRLWLILGGGEARLWRSGPGGTVQGVFAPIDLAVI